MASSTPRFLLAGLLQREYLLLPSGKSVIDAPGGNLLYAAAGLAVWEPQPPPGLLARVGEDYPQDWFDLFTHRGLDTRGVHILPEAMDVRGFMAYPDQKKRVNDEPVAHFARLGLPFPKALLGYRPPAALNSRIRLLPVSLRPGDIPEDYLGAGVAHLCPIDYLTHSLIPAVLRQASFNTITVDPASAYMNPTFWGDVPALVSGLTAFMPSEEEARMLFQGRSADLWEIAEALAGYGCELIVIKRGELGKLVYDAAAHRRYELTAYPARVADLTGAGDAFCGGFLAGYRRSYDALEAALYGNVSASLAIEGSGPFFALDALSGLAEARLEALRQSVKVV